MRILVNAIPLKGLLTGISRYVRQLYTEIERLPGVEVHYFDGLRATDRMPGQASPAGWSFFTKAVWKLPDTVVFMLRLITWYNYERRLRAVCRAKCPDIYHETTFFPAALPGVPQVQTIYDLSLVKYPSAHPRERIMYFNFFSKRRMHYAAHWIAISNFVKEEAARFFNIGPGSITSIPLAGAQHFYRRSQEEIKTALSSLALPDRFLLFVGSLEPRKNLPLLMEAVRTAKSTLPLVIAGWEGWGSKEWLQHVRGSSLAARVFLTGYTNDEKLACLYSAAAALVYPSLYEGFGLPVLEAMACGCPVICSNTSSLPEVAGDAAILIDPASKEELARAINLLVGDNEIRKTCIRRGLARSSQFTWQRCAEKTLEVFRSVAVNKAYPGPA